MKRIVLLAFAALVALLGADQVRKLGAARDHGSVARMAASEPGRPAAGTVEPADSSPPDSGGGSIGVYARLEARRLLESSAGVTYVDSLFLETDSIVRRWRDRQGLALPVSYVPSGDGAVDARLREVLARALEAWESAGAGLRFLLTEDSSRAMIQVRAVQRLEGERAGQTDLRWTRDGSIHAASISVALEASDGARVRDEGLFAVTSHEIGHALGLPHSSDPMDVMFATTRTGTPTERDHRSLRLLYSLPLGSVREGPDE